jgi:hypothetical protein
MSEASRGSDVPVGAAVPPSPSAPGPMGMRAWYTKVSANRRRLFAGRHYDDVTVTDGEVVVRTRHGQLLLQAPAASLQVVRVRTGLLLQVLVRDQERNTHVFEFRPRRHREGRALADALH